MEQSYMSLLVGAIIGAVVCFLTILAVNLLKNQSSSKNVASREKIMRQIGELCAEIDSLIISNKEGILNNGGIQTALRKKNDEIIRLLKPNMHILDVYFVKYMDYVQRDYQKYLIGTHIDPEVSSLQSKSIAFSIDSNSDLSKQESHQTAISSRTGSVEQDLHALEKAFFKEPVKDTRKKTLETIFAQPKEELSAASTDKTEKSFFSDNVTPDEFFESKSTLVTKPTDSIKQAEIPVFSEKAKAEEPVAEEDFTMETIMDLDISKLNFTKSTPLHDFSRKTESKKEAVTNGEELFEPKPATKVEPAPEAKDVRNDLTGEIESKPLSKLAEEKVEGPGNPVPVSTGVELKPKPVLPKKHSEEPPAISSAAKKDISITGDDVADKIDEFFGIEK